MTGDSGLPVPADLWLVNPWVAGMGKAWVQVQVRLKVPMGYPCGSLVTTHMFCSCLPFTYMHAQLTNQLELFPLPHRAVTSNSHLPTMLSTLRTTKKDRIHSTPFYTIL